MAEAQIRFKISNQSLKRLDSYVPTEGSENYVHISFEVDSDTNVENAVLAVFARYDNEVYVVPVNSETGFYDIPVFVNQYPGFYISCRLFNESVSRYTEEVFINVSGNGNILKRYVKSSNEYSLELFSQIIANISQNSLDISKFNDKLDVILLALTEMANNEKASYSTLAERITSLSVKDDIITETPEDTNNTSGNTDELVSGDGFFVG